MEANTSNLEEGEIESGEEFDMSPLDNEADVDRIIEEIKRSVLNNQDVDWRIPPLQSEVHKLKDHRHFAGPSPSKRPRKNEVFSSEETVRESTRRNENSPVEAVHKASRTSEKSLSKTVPLSSRSPLIHELPITHFNPKYQHKHFYDYADASLRYEAAERPMFSLPPPPPPPSLHLMTEDRQPSLEEKLLQDQLPSTPSVSNGAITLSKGLTGLSKENELSEKTLNRNLCDNYEQVNMEISNSDEEVTEPSRVIEKCINDDHEDEAESLRALLLSQVKRKQAEKSAQRLNNYYVEAEETIESSSAPNQVLQSPESPQISPIASDQSESDGPESYIEEKILLDFGQIDHDIDDELRKVEDLNRKIDYHRKEYEANLKKKSKLMKNLQACEKAMDSHHDEMLRLSQKLCRALRETLDTKKMVVNKAEVAQERMKERIEKLRVKGQRIKIVKENTPVIPLDEQPSTSTAGPIVSQAPVIDEIPRPRAPVIPQVEIAEEMIESSTTEVSILPNEIIEKSQTLLTNSDDAHQQRSKRSNVVETKRIIEKTLGLKKAKTSPAHASTKSVESPTAANDQSMDGESSNSAAFDQIANSLGQYVTQLSKCSKNLMSESKHGRTQRVDDVEASLLNRIMSRSRIKGKEESSQNLTYEKARVIKEKKVEIKRDEEKRPKVITPSNSQKYESSPSNAQEFLTDRLSCSTKQLQPALQNGVEKVTLSIQVKLTAEQIRRLATSRLMNPSLPLCYYELNGRCADRTCPWQHEHDFSISDQEILCGILQKFLPKEKVPNNLSYPEYVKIMLASNTFDHILNNWYKKVSDLPARIECFLKSLSYVEKSIPQDAEVPEYDVPERMHNRLVPPRVEIAE